MGICRLISVVLAVPVLAACSSSPYSPSDANVLNQADSVEGRNPTSCSSLFQTIMRRERSGDTARAIDAELDELGGRCPKKYQVFVDYVSVKSFADVGAGGSCAEYSAYDLRAKALRMARRHGYCSAGDQVATVPDTADWECTYSPTYNNDWHDDVVCTNGSEQVRPSLRNWDSFVTEAEIMESAREYEAQLNGG